ncbi:MAG: hypothetical protein KBT62_13460, partial [Sulfitobacter litoralis]|uniref:hypothetical protein n=1 Tax=Sulfitobacter litoralis TaxID=335975 RepID=UPI001B556710
FFNYRAVVLDPRGFGAGRTLEELFVLLARNNTSKHVRRRRFCAFGSLEGVRENAVGRTLRVTTEV